MRLCRIIRPDDHLAAIPPGCGVGADGGTRPKIRGLGVGNRRVLALVVAANAHGSARKSAVCINLRLVCQYHAIAKHIYRTTAVARSHNLARTLHHCVSSRFQQDPAALIACCCRLNNATVPQGASKNANRIAFQCPQVDRSIAGRLHLQGNALQSTTGHFDLLSGSQNRVAVGCLNQRVLASGHTGAQQHHISTARQHLAKNRHGSGRRCAVTKAQPTRKGVGIGHPEAGRSETRRIDHSTCANGNT